MAKVDMEDLSGMVTAIVQTTGISGNEAGTAIKSFMSRLYRTDMSDPEELGRTAKALKEIADIDVSDGAGSIRGFNDIIEETATKWKDMTEQEKIATAQAMGSTYHYSKFVALMESYAIKIDAATKSRNSENSALEENQKVLDSIGGRLGLLKVAGEEFWRSILNSDALKAIVSSMTYLVSTFANLNTIVMTATIALIAFKGMQIATIVSAWAGSFLLWATSVRSATFSQMIFNSTLLLTQARLAGVTAAQIGAMAATTGLSGAVTALGFAFRGLVTFIGPVGLLVGALTALTIGYNIRSQNKEKEAQATADNIRNLSAEKESLISLKAEYEEIIKAGNLTSESKARLKGIQDLLTKTYGIEADELNLVNGEYKKQIDILDKLAVSKATEQLASMGNSGEDALSRLNDDKTTRFGAGDYRGNRSKVDSIFDSVVGKSIGQDNRGKELYEINGTLKERVSILLKLSNELSKVADKDKYTKTIIKDVTDEYNKLNNELKEVNETLGVYIPAKSIVDFANIFEKELSKVSDLKEKLLKNPDDIGLNKQFDDLHDEMIEIAKNKGKLEELRPVIDALFSKAPDKLTNKLTDLKKAIESASESTETYLSSSKDLASTVAKMNDGHKLTTEELYKLVKAHPELAKNMVKVNGLYTIETKAILDVMEAKNKAHKESLAQKKKELEESEKLLKKKLQLYGEEVGGITSVQQAKELVNSKSLADPENRALYAGRQSILTELQAIEDALKNMDVSSQISVKDLIASANPDLNKDAKNKENLEVVTGPFAELIRASAKQNGISATLLDALIKQESGFRANVVSPSGAVGLTQLMPSTAKSLGVTNSYDPAQNIQGGAKYLKQQLDKFGGDISLALAAYNAGPEAVAKYGNKIPPYKETQDYVKKVLGDYNARKNNQTAVDEIGEKKQENPQYTETTDALIRQINQQQLLTKAKSESIQKELDLAKSSDDYQLQLEKTTSLLSSQQTRLEELQIAKDKINEATPQGYWDWFTVDNEASLNYLTLLNTQSADTQKETEALFTKIQKLRKAWVENKVATEELTSANNDLQKSFADIRKEAYDSIIDTNTKIADDSIAMLKKAIETVKDLELKAIDQRIAKENERHDNIISNLDAELKALQDQENANDYAKQLTKAQQEVRDTQNELTIWERNDSIEAIAKRAELSKELAEKQENLADMQNKHNVDLRKRDLENQKNIETNKYNNIKDSLEKERKDREYYWNETLNNEQKFSDMRTQIINGNTSEINSSLNEYLTRFKSANQQNIQEIGASWTALQSQINAIKNMQMNIPNIQNPNMYQPSAVKNVYGNSVDIALAQAEAIASGKAGNFNFVTVSNGNAGMAGSGDIVLGGSGVINNSGSGTQLGGSDRNETLNKFKEVMSQINNSSSGTSASSNNSGSSSNSSSGSSSGSSGSSGNSSSTSGTFANPLSLNSNSGSGVYSIVENNGKLYNVDKNTGTVYASWKYKEGGETEKSGLHWLDGESGKPERVLSSEQTLSFNKLVNFLPKLGNLTNFKIPNFNNLALANNTASRSPNNITINFDNFRGTIQDQNNISKTIVNTLKKVGFNDF